MKKPVSSSHGWEPATTVQIEQCLCCKKSIKANSQAYRTKQPGARNWLGVNCYSAWVKSGGRPLYELHLYRESGRISEEKKRSRAAVAREAVKRSSI